MRISDWSSDVCSSDLRPVSSDPSPTTELTPILQDSWSEFLIWAIPCFFDGVFLIAWLISNWLLAKAAVFFPPTGSDALLFETFKFVFAISTLMAVITYVVKDIAIMVGKTTVHLRKTRTIIDNNQTDKTGN